MRKLQAVSKLLKRIEANPGEAELYQQLGRVYLKNKEVEKAKDAYDRAFVLDPQDPWTRLYLGNWHYTQDEYKEALRHFKAAAKQMPDLAIPFICLGDVYSCLEIDALATENYRRALKLEPNDKAAKKRWRKWVKVWDEE